jgi:hypothetical protein
LVLISCNRQRNREGRAYADAGLWWSIGSNLLAPDRGITAAVLDWYACQDVDQSTLLSMQESADWQDLFCTRGKGLYLNCLYVLALHAAGEHQRARFVAEKINRYFWYEGDGNMLRHVAHTFSTETGRGTRWGASGGSVAGFGIGITMFPYLGIPPSVSGSTL